jgi:hypothetical protein
MNSVTAPADFRRIKQNNLILSFSVRVRQIAADAVEHVKVAEWP